MLWPTQEKPTDLVWEAFHRAWSACVGTPDYDKSVWKAAEAQLLQAISNQTALTKLKPKPMFICQNCGAEGNCYPFRNGCFSSSLFEYHYKQFMTQHKQCLPIQDGGCI